MVNGPSSSSAKIFRAAGLQVVAVTLRRGLRLFRVLAVSLGALSFLPLILSVFMGVDVVGFLATFLGEVAVSGLDDLLRFFLPFELEEPLECFLHLGSILGIS